MFTEESLEFQDRISRRNGLGEQTALPPSLHLEPPVITLDTAREEAELVMFACVEEVLGKAGQGLGSPALSAAVRHPVPALQQKTCAVCRRLGGHVFARDGASLVCYVQG